MVGKSLNKEKSMCLICKESQEKIPVNSGLFAVTQEGSVHFFAVSGEKIREIPESKRGQIPFKTGEKGINVHRATSEMEKELFAGRNFRLGEFAFSVPANAAWELLPNVTGNFVKKRR